MPRSGRSRGGGGGGSGVSYPFGPPPARSSYSAAGFTPGRQQLPKAKPPPAASPQPQHPGLFKQAAATAGGVAAGSLIAGAIMGPRERVIVVDNSQNQQQQQPADPCSKEVTELLQCIQMIQQTNEGISACEAFRIKLGKCREKYGDPYSGGGGG